MAKSDSQNDFNRRKVFVTRRNLTSAVCCEIESIIVTSHSESKSGKQRFEINHILYLAFEKLAP